MASSQTVLRSFSVHLSETLLAISRNAAQKRNISLERFIELAVTEKLERIRSHPAADESPSDLTSA